MRHPRSNNSLVLFGAIPSIQWNRVVILNVYTLYAKHSLSKDLDAALLAPNSMLLVKVS